MLGRFARNAAPNTLGALSILVGLAILVPTTGTPTGLLAVYLVLIAIVTLPHVVVVTWMDYREGVWAVGSTDEPTPVPSISEE